MESTENKNFVEESVVVEQVAEASANDYGSLQTADLVGALRDVVAKATESDVKGEIEALKIAFYKRHKLNVEEAKRSFVEQGGDESAFVPQQDESESIFKELLTQYKQIKAAQKEEHDRILAENLQKKQAILQQLGALVESNEDINETLPKFKELTQEWRTIGKVAPEFNNDIFKQYNLLQEHFYDIIKINNELRDYDFKKNLELKTALCEKAEALAEVESVVSAFQNLQALHEEWRNIGPVAKELRESIWNRFKEASTAVNKRHQQHFEAIKAQEVDNLAKKTALCEKLEAIDLASFTSFKQWEDATALVEQVQEQWRTIGFAPRKDNVKIYERFRAICNEVYKQKSLYFKQKKEELNQNLKRKEQLCQQVEVLKESSDWNETAKKIVALQKEWKSIGAVQKRYSDAVWERFTKACNEFFDRRKEALKEQHSEESENLKAKQAIVERLKALEMGDDDEQNLALLRSIEKEWNAIGFVPFKHKNALYEQYKQLMDEYYSKIKRRDTNKGLQHLNRNQLQKLYKSIQAEIQTCENNLGFFASSKKTNKLVTDLQRKIERRKEDLEAVAQLLDASEE